MSETTGTRSHSREILSLAVPAFLALVAEPLFLLADSAIVGHLGTQALAGLGVASAILLSAVGVFVFLAYATTSVVARQLGAGNLRGALAAGVDGAWLALILGLVAGTGIWLAAEPLVRFFGASDEAVQQGVSYLQVAAVGIPFMLITLSASGVLRGLQDTRTPLVVSVVAFSANVVMNLVFVHVFGWGIAGSAWGTVIAQAFMATTLLAVVIRGATRHQAELRPDPLRVLRAARHGAPLLVRTLALRAILLVTTWVAAGLGDVPLAAYQVSSTIWSTLAFAMDALAIAAQALTGRALGSGDIDAVRGANKLMIRWGLAAGAVLGLGVLAVHRVAPLLFTGEPAVQDAISVALIVVGLSAPLSGYIFVVDGVLIGAGDGRWLAGAMTWTLVGYLPLALAVHLTGDRLLQGVGSISGSSWAVGWLWVAFTGFMLIRGALMGLRMRGTDWMVVGAHR